MHLLSVWLHILAAAIWIGGMIFLTLVLLPVVRRTGYREHGRLVHLTGARFRAVAWICLAVLIATGFLNLWYRGFGWTALTNGGFWLSSFGLTLGLKLLLVAVILNLSVWHDMSVGPSVTAAWEEDPDSEEARRLRRVAAWFGRLNLLLGLVVLALAVALVRGGLF